MRAIPLLLCLSALLAADEARVRELLAQLGADESDAREAADAELRKTGAEDATGEVERLLEEGARSEDAELATRSREILDEIRSWERIVVIGGRATGGVDLRSGKYLWSRPRGWCTAWCGPRGRNARAWVFDRDGGLECVDLRTGARHWRVQARGWGQSVGDAYWLGFSSTSVIRISLEDGATVWEVELPQPIHHVRPASVAADSQGVYIETQEYLIALDAATGRELWQSSDSLLGLTRGALCVQHDETIRRLDTLTGEPLWTHAAPGGRPATTILGGKELLLIANDQGHTMAVEAATGKDVWTLDARPEAMWVEPTGTRGWLAAEGALIVLDLGSGKELTRFPRDCEAARFLHEDGVLYVADYQTIDCDVALRAFDVEARTLLWSADVEGIQVGHSKYWQTARVERLGDRLLFVGESAGGSWIEVVDRTTGRVTTRHRP